MILHRDAEKSTHYNIVDGQQRIITFSLMLQAIQSLLVKEEKVTIQFLNQSLSENPFNKRNIPSNYRTLDRRIGNIEERERNSLLDYIKHNCELIVLITDDISEAFQFFDAQNARGKKLYPHDLLKAYHLREMNHLKTADLVESVKEWENLDQKKLQLVITNI